MWHGEPGRIENCFNCALAMDARLGGRAASALRGSRNPSINHDLFQLQRTFGAGPQRCATRAEIEQMLLAAGRGARAIVIGVRNTGRAHVFNAANQRGQTRDASGRTQRNVDVVRFIDPQEGGGNIEVFDHYWVVRTNASAAAGRQGGVPSARAATAPSPSGPSAGPGAGAAPPERYRPREAARHAQGYFGRPAQRGETLRGMALPNMALVFASRRQAFAAAKRLIGLDSSAEPVRQGSFRGAMSAPSGYGGGRRERWARRRSRRTPGARAGGTSSRRPDSRLEIRGRRGDRRSTSSNMT